MSIYETARLNMIEHQLRPNKVTDERVLAAFNGIRRELFVPEKLRGIAYIDEDLPLGGGRYMMEPLVAARLIQAAALGRAEVALEQDPQLARRARAALVEHGLAAVSVVEGPLREGWRPRAPYDVILFGGAIAEVPADIKEQLAEGGRLVAVIKPEDAPGRAMLMMRTNGLFGRRLLFDAATPLLPGFAPEPAFVF